MLSKGRREVDEEDFASCQSSWRESRSLTFLPIWYAVDAPLALCQQCNCASRCYHHISCQCDVDAVTRWSPYRGSAGCWRQVSSYTRDNNMESIRWELTSITAARDLTLEAARDAGPRKSNRALPAAQIKKMLDSRQERDVLDGLRRVVAVCHAHSSELLLCTVDIDWLDRCSMPTLHNPP